MAKLKELVHWDQSATGQSPSFWVDEETGDFYFQGYKIDGDTRIQASLPNHEDMVRVPASFWEQLRKYAQNS